MHRHVPNLLTALRLVLATIFFVMLALYQYQGRGDPLFLIYACILYAIALFTDFLDGFLARRWNVETPFGRIVDPFVDKILVLGSFAFFAGKNFVIPTHGGDYIVKTITGVAPAMVIVLLARELLITSLRGLQESSGQAFGAAFSGKLKMFVQSVTIMVILIYVNYRWWFLLHDWDTYAVIVRDIFIWATIAITIFSGLLYVRRAMTLFRNNG